MSRYEREDWPGRALAIIRERICALPEFAAARRLVLLRAVGDCCGLTVEQMRELGGFSEVIRRHINLLPSIYWINHGSNLFPRSVVDVLSEIVPELRGELQAALARANGERAAS